MTPKQILFLDRTAGRLACALLSTFETIRRLVSSRPNAAPKRIVFVKLIEMGSSVLACPAFEEASRRVGRENLFILLFTQNRPVIDVLPYFPQENVLTIDDSGLGTFAAGLWRSMRRLRREGVDAAVDLEGLTRSSAVITYLTGARTRVGYHNFHAEGPYRGRLFTHELNYNFQHHVSTMFQALVIAAFEPPGQVPMLKQTVSPHPLPVYRPTPDEVATLNSRMTEAAGTPPGRPLVLLNPNCSDLLPLRRWPESAMIDLGKRILDTVPTAMVVITGAPSEQSEAERMSRAIDENGRCICMAGRTSFRELLTLYTIADAMVSNDSGPCHFASLTSLAVVALFGPETSQLYGPLGENKVAVSANLACSPCVNMLNHRFSPCTDNQCMKQLSVDVIFAELEGVLQRPSAQSTGA